MENQLQSQVDRFRNALTQRGYGSIAEIWPRPGPAAEETIREFSSESLEGYGDATAVMFFSNDDASYRPVGALRGALRARRVCQQPASPDRRSAEGASPAPAA